MATTTPTPNDGRYSKAVMLFKWVTRRPPQIVFLRIYDQLYRRATGAPIIRFSRITPQLYVGGQHRRHGLPRMASLGITAVVNLRSEHDDEAAGVALKRYLHLSVIDNTPLTPENLRDGVAFIREEIAQGGVVYIHCGVGVGRAPTMAAAYLVSTGLTPDEAWAQLQGVRPFVWPNKRQRACVDAYAATYAPNQSP